MWSVEPSDEYLRRHKRFEKKRPRELAAMLHNLDVFTQALQSGAKPQNAKFGFVHVEPLNVLAIDQKGGGAGLAQARLYVYAHTETLTVHLLTIGDKQSQSDDIAFCKEYVTGLLARTKEE